MASGAAGYVYRPRDAGGVAEAIGAARRANVPIALRGAGCSYGDAALRGESVVLDLSELNRILAWDPETGIIDVEPVPQLHVSPGVERWIVPGFFDLQVNGFAGRNFNDADLKPVHDFIEAAQARESWLNRLDGWEADQTADQAKILGDSLPLGLQIVTGEIPSK